MVSVHTATRLSIAAVSRTGSLIKNPIALCILATLSALCISFPALPAGQSSKQPNRALSGLRSESKSGQGYIGSTACASCHGTIYREYQKTAMGRSIVPADSAVFPQLTVPDHFTSTAIDRHFDVSIENGKLQESEYALAQDSTETFRDTRSIQWLIGAGINGYGPVVERDHYLFQGPLSFYSKTKSWGPSPGYEQMDLGFNRPLLTGCVFCHSGRANPIPGTNGQYSDPPFSEVAIGCENCHGPGAEHVKAIRAANSSARETRIVNPAKLSPYLADNICMACHQTGDVRVLKPAKSYEDVRPGRPLDDVLSIFMVPPTRESPPDADHVEHYYSMMLSKCYRSSSGRMSCITCHDPHVQPSATEAPAYFRSKCITCHSEKSCTVPLAARLHQQPADNCVGCHMPKRDIQVISHSTATNHRILARADEPFPEATFHLMASALPDLIDLDPAPGKETSAPDLLTLLQAYGELSADKPQYVERYLDVLSTLEKSTPDNALVAAAVGRRELKSGNFASAIEHLEHAVQLAPPQATTCADLADAYAHTGRPEDAVQWLDKSVKLDPFNPFTQRSLIAQLINLKQYPRARSALEHYVEVFPQDTFMRQMLAKASRLPLQ